MISTPTLVSKLNGRQDTGSALSVEPNILWASKDNEGRNLRVVIGKDGSLRGGILMWHGTPLSRSGISRPQFHSISMTTHFQPYRVTPITTMGGLRRVDADIIQVGDRT